MTGVGTRGATRWCLESTADGGRSVDRVPMHQLPFRIGRSLGLDLTIPSRSVSKRHAEFRAENQQLRLRDLSSTNGTFVNRKRIKETLVREGDIIHFAGFEFRLRQQPGTVTPGEGAEHGTLSLAKLELPSDFVGGTHELGELIERRMVSAVLQPIVSLSEGETLAYEVLGRGLHPDLPGGPNELFRIAESTDRGSELSRLFREKAIELARGVEAELPMLFFNMHPAELGSPELIASLRHTRQALPQVELALEIHEGALATPHVIGQLKRRLEELNIRLALDDFGLGERFLQLAEVPPHYLKFDISLVKGLVDASSSKRRLLQMLMAAAREVGAEPIAEGIETEEEANVCTGMGFTLAQGYLYSKPIEFADLDDPSCKTLQKTSTQAIPRVAFEKLTGADGPPGANRPRRTGASGVPPARRPVPDPSDET